MCAASSVLILERSAVSYPQINQPLLLVFAAHETFLTACITHPYRARLNIRRASRLNAALALTRPRGITRFAT